MKSILAILLIQLFLFGNYNSMGVKVEPKVKTISYKINPADSGEVFNSQLTKSELVKIFGKENVSEKSEWFEEGTVEKIVTVLFKESNNEIALNWKADNTLANIKLTEPNSEWSVNGVKVGMTLAEVEKVNSKDFNFYGFGWDNGGFIYNWNNGTLADSLKNIGVTLSLDWEKVGNKNIDNFMGDSVKLKSNNKKIKKLGVTVYSIIIKY